MKVEKDFTIITASSIGPSVVIVIRFVEPFKTDIVVNVIMCLTSHKPILFSITVCLLILTMSLGEIKKMSKYTYIVTYCTKKMSKYTYIVTCCTKKCLNILT